MEKKRKNLLTVYTKYSENYAGIYYGIRVRGIVCANEDDPNIKLLKDYLNELEYIHFTVICNDQQLNELQLLVNKANKLQVLKHYE